MKSAIALLSFVAAAAAGGVSGDIAPSGSYPAGCSKDYSGQVEVTIAAVTKTKRNLIHKRGECGTDGILVMSLSNGVLTDSKGRTGYIASNYQFQFDNPPQAGAIYTAGFSFCGNDSLALGGSTTWYQCQSGSFWNLYDRNWAAQCEPVEIIALPCGGSSSGAGSEGNDGQVVATQLQTTTIVKPLTDGQPQVITTAVPIPICQINDGQVQGHTTPCASITTTAKPVSTAAPVSQYSDGQIQVTKPGTGAPPPPAQTTAPAPATTPAAAGTTPAAVTTPPAVTVPAPTTLKTFSSSSSNSTRPFTTSKSVSVASTSSAATTSASAVSANAAFRTEMSSFAALAIALAAGFLAL